MTINPKLGEKRAMMIYSKLWKMLIDSRTKSKYDFKKGYKVTKQKMKEEWEAQASANERGDAKISMIEKKGINAYNAHLYK